MFIKELLFVRAYFTFCSLTASGFQPLVFGRVYEHPSPHPRGVRVTPQNGTPGVARDPVGYLQR